MAAAGLEILRIERGSIAARDSIVVKRNRGLPAETFRNVLSQAIRKAAGGANRRVEERYDGKILLRIEERVTAVSAGRPVVPVITGIGFKKPGQCDFHSR